MTHGDLALEKRELRRRMLAVRQGIAPAAAAAAAEAVAAHLLADPLFGAAQRVLLYAALPGELPTRPLFERLGRLGVARLLPRVRRGRIEFAEVREWGELRGGVFGVLEPPDACAEVAPGRGDVAVVPGVAFDRRGNRLGHGRGYYDRAFAGPESALPRLIGAAFELQLVPAVPHDSRDRRMDAIVTERGLQWIAGPT